MANLARFLIGSSPSSAGGHDVNPGDTPVLRLEASSSLVHRVTFEVHSAAAGAPRATNSAPTLTLSNGATTGQSVDAATTASGVTVSAGIPAVRAPHLWEVRCAVNGGVNSDGSVNPDYVFSRFVAMRSADGLRKIMVAERGEYDTAEAWAAAINDIVEAGVSGASIRVNGTISTALATGSDFPISLASGVATFDPNNRLLLVKWHNPKVRYYVPFSLIDDVYLECTYPIGYSDLDGLGLEPSKTYAAIVSGRILIKKTSTPSTFTFVDIVSTVTIVTDAIGGMTFTHDSSADAVSVIGAAELAPASASVTCISTSSFLFNIRRPPGVDCTFVSADTAIIELQEVS